MLDGEWKVSITPVVASLRADSPSQDVVARSRDLDPGKQHVWRCPEARAYAFNNLAVVDEIGRRRHMACGPIETNDQLGALFASRYTLNAKPLRYAEFGRVGHPRELPALDLWAVFPEGRKTSLKVQTFAPFVQNEVRLPVADKGIRVWSNTQLDGAARDSIQSGTRTGDPGF